ncbi:glycosyltransferase family A protein, partial [Acinetobacter baumannii]
ALNSGDIASARNAGIEASSGNYISLLDGDDIWCENWLVDCHRLSEKTSYKNIFRPEVVITFEKKVEIQVCLDQESPHFKLESMVTDK